MNFHSHLSDLRLRPSSMQSKNKSQKMRAKVRIFHCNISKDKIGEFSLCTCSDLRLRASLVKRIGTSGCMQDRLVFQHVSIWAHALDI